MERESDRSGRPNTPLAEQTMVVRDDSGIRTTHAGVALIAAISKGMVLLSGEDLQEEVGESESRENNHERPS